MFIFFSLTPATATVAGLSRDQTAFGEGKSLVPVRALRKRRTPSRATMRSSDMARGLTSTSSMAHALAPPSQKCARSWRKPSSQRSMAASSARRLPPRTLPET